MILADRGSLCMDDHPGFLMEGKCDLLWGAILLEKLVVSEQIKMLAHTGNLVALAFGDIFSCEITIWGWDDKVYDFGDI